MTRIIALSPKKNTSKRPYKSPKRLAKKRETLAKNTRKKGRAGKIGKAAKKGKK